LVSTPSWQRGIETAPGSFWESLKLEQTLWKSNLATVIEITNERMFILNQQFHFALVAFFPLNHLAI
jgi:hypothetical protein